MILKILALSALSLFVLIMVMSGTIATMVGADALASSTYAASASASSGDGLAAYAYIHWYVYFYGTPLKGVPAGVEYSTTHYVDCHTNSRGQCTIRVIPNYKEAWLSTTYLQAGKGECMWIEQETLPSAGHTQVLKINFENC